MSATEIHWRGQIDGISCFFHQPWYIHTLTHEKLFLLTFERPSHGHFEVWSINPFYLSFEKRVVFNQAGSTIYWQTHSIMILAIEYKVSRRELMELKKNLLDSFDDMCSAMVWLAGKLPNSFVSLFPAALSTLAQDRQVFVDWKVENMEYGLWKLFPYTSRKQIVSCIQQK